MAEQVRSEFMSAAEVADDLNVSLKHVRRLIKNGELPHYKFGSVIRVHRDDINNYVSKCKSK